jgi:hypothetical protein
MKEKEKNHKIINNTMSPVIGNFVLHHSCPPHTFIHELTVVFFSLDISHSMRCQLVSVKIRYFQFIIFFRLIFPFIAQNINYKAIYQNSRKSKKDSQEICMTFIVDNLMICWCSFYVPRDNNLTIRKSYFV